MKKTLSVLLAVLLAALTFAPAFAADGHSVTFIQPSPTLETVDGVAPYYFVKTNNGEIEYVEDENGQYVVFNGRFMHISNVIEPEQYTFKYYSPVECKPVDTVADGEIVSFIVATNKVYNVATVSVYVNNEKIEMQSNGEYRVYCDRDLTISVKETDNEGNDILLRNSFVVSMPSDEGYKVKTLEGENYKLVPYGGSFSFRVKITKGYTDSGMTVKYMQGNNGLSDLLGEDADSMISMLPADASGQFGIKIETLASTGVDENGYRIYTIDNITDNVKIMVSGVKEQSSSGFLSILKRILRLVLDFLGIKSDIFNSFVATYEVAINAPDSQNVDYEITSGTVTEGITPSVFVVGSGDSITLQVATTYADCDNHVQVNWVYEDGAVVNGNTYNSKWVANRNKNTGAIYYTRIFVIDNITSNVKVTITEK